MPSAFIERIDAIGSSYVTKIEKLWLINALLCLRILYIIVLLGIELS